MILADKILVSLFNANSYSATLMNEIVAREVNGENDQSIRDEFVILGQWIRILQNYYDLNFDEAGNNITPEYPCLTQTQIEKLMGKLKTAQGSNKYDLTNMFQLGIWLESLDFYWDDSLTWYDAPNLN